MRNKVIKCSIEAEDHWILKSWANCQQGGLNPHIHFTSQPDSVPLAQRTINPLMSYFRHYVLQKLLVIFYESVDRYGGALFYAYENKVIFSQRGNRAMLDYFNRLNIGIGSSIDEQHIGTTAASVVKSGEEIVLNGNKHYLDILKPFASYCHLSGEEFAHAYTLIFLPNESLTEHFIQQVQLYKVARNSALAAHSKSIEFVAKNDLFERLSQYTSQAVLLLDGKGKIVNVNQHFKNWFNVTSADVLNLEFSVLFPELREMLQRVLTKEKIFQEKVSLKKLPSNMQYLYIDMMPTETPAYPGVVVSFSPVKGTPAPQVKCDRFKTAHYTFEHIVGNCETIRKLKQMAINAALGSSSIIITGESGTGKELFAQAIHNASARNHQPFISINCSAIPPELIASELLGYEEGAFTGSKKGGSIGKLEYANKGTLFLDEIGEMPMTVQTTLLRVLEEREITRIGSNKVIPIDIRLLCATNKDLLKMVHKGTFRLDLYYRINVLNLHLPPLRKRVQDIPLLIKHYLRIFNHSFSKKISGISTEALHIFTQHPWPGNLRELRNAVECCVNSAHEKIQLKDIPKSILEYQTITNSQSRVAEDHFTLSQAEKNKLFTIMMRHNGNKSQVAKELGIARSTLYKKLKDHHLV